MEHYVNSESGNFINLVVTTHSSTTDATLSVWIQLISITAHAESYSYRQGCLSGTLGITRFSFAR
jgi:hypothetical protein